jgi:hypothetical protein
VAAEFLKFVFQLIAMKKTSTTAKGPIAIKGRKFDLNDEGKDIYRKFREEHLHGTPRMSEGIHYGDPCGCVYGCVIESRNLDSVKSITDYLMSGGVLTANVGYGYSRVVYRDAKGEEKALEVDHGTGWLLKKIEGKEADPSEVLGLLGYYMSVHWGQNESLETTVKERYDKIRKTIQKGFVVKFDPKKQPIFV